MEDIALAALPRHIPHESDDVSVGLVDTSTKKPLSDCEEGPADGNYGHDQEAEYHPGYTPSQPGSPHAIDNAFRVAISSIESLRNDPRERRLLDPSSYLPSPSPPPSDPTPDFKEPRAAGEWDYPYTASRVSRDSELTGNLPTPSTSAGSRPEGIGINVKNYPCLYPGCEHISGRPFDLQGHMEKHHPPIAEKMYDCPDAEYGHVGEHGFDRKDHMREHLRNSHNRDVPKPGAHGGRSSRG